jgi:hypothetical protein
MAEKVRDMALELYRFGAEYALDRGIIIADTKFEFGMLDDELILIDEIMTPDSSRFWPADGYEPGKSQPSYDKQYVRDYLETLDWDKTAPGPELPPEVAAKTSEKYLEAWRRLTSRELRAPAGRGGAQAADPSARPSRHPQASLRTGPAVGLRTSVCGATAPAGSLACRRPPLLRRRGAQGP